MARQMVGGLRVGAVAFLAPAAFVGVAGPIAAAFQVMECGPGSPDDFCAGPGVGNFVLSNGPAGLRPSCCTFSQTWQALCWRL